MLPKEEYANRRSNLQQKIREFDLDCFLISDPESIYYFTGATYKAQERPFFIVMWPDRDPSFVVPKLEEDHMAKANLGNVQAYWEYPSPPGKGWPEILARILEEAKNIGIEPGLSLENYQKLPHKDLQPLDLVAGQRLIKTDREIQKIRQTAKLADLGMQLILNNAYFGVSVLEMFSLGRKIQMEVIKQGEFDPLNCDFLTATWPAPFSAKPHGVPPVDGKLKKGPLAAMSYLRVNGYAAECERTFFLDKPSDRIKEIFQAMRNARQLALEKVKPGIKCGDIDRVALNYLREEGYGDYLLHRTGHGIGLGNHEGPWVAAGSDHILKANMVISIEPGIYIPELGGFRHSDTVLVTSTGYELLTKCPRDLDSLTIVKPRWIKKVKGNIIQKVLRI